MDSLISAEGGNEAPFSHKTTRDILKYTRIISPIALLVIFLLAFVLQSVISAKGGGNVNRGTGPGGRPLPKRTRSSAVVNQEPVDFSENVKLGFKWLSVAVLMTFLVDAAVNMVHVLFHRRENWWCGQSVVVSISKYNFLSKVIKSLTIL